MCDKLWDVLLGGVRFSSHIMTLPFLVDDLLKIRG